MATPTASRKKVEATRDRKPPICKRGRRRGSDLERYIIEQLDKALTCPTCNLVTRGGWCPLCGDQYPWSRP